MDCPFCKALVFLADVSVSENDDASLDLEFGCFRCQKTFRANVGKEDFKEIKP